MDGSNYYTTWNEKYRKKRLILKIGLLENKWLMMSQKNPNEYEKIAMLKSRLRIIFTHYL